MLFALTLDLLRIYWTIHKSERFRNVMQIRMNFLIKNPGSHVVKF